MEDVGGDGVIEWDCYRTGESNSDEVQRFTDPLRSDHQPYNVYTWTPHPDRHTRHQPLVACPSDMAPYYKRL